MTTQRFNPEKDLAPMPFDKILERCEPQDNPGGQG